MHILGLDGCNKPGWEQTQSSLVQPAQIEMKQSYWEWHCILHVSALRMELPELC